MITTFLALPRWAHGLIAVAVAVLAFLAWDAWDDRQAVEQDRAEQAAQIAAEREAAAQRAAEQAAVDALANAQTDERNAAAIAQAQASYPAEVKQQAGPATRAVLDQIGRQ